MRGGRTISVVVFGEVVYSKEHHTKMDKVTHTHEHTSARTPHSSIEKLKGWRVSRLLPRFEQSSRASLRPLSSLALFLSHSAMRIDF